MDKGVIYMITNKVNGKKYIGQAVNFTGKNNQPWGTIGRWKSHIREALNPKNKDHCTLLNNAIRKYGSENFEATTLCEVLLEELDNEEEKFITEYDTTNQTKGYNLKKGGARASFTEESNQRRSESKKGRKNSEEHVRKSKIGQIGTRRGPKVRKYPEDVNLPKYIYCRRYNGVITGYEIAGFPIGVNEKEYINQRFRNKNDPEQALEDAKKYLQELKDKYESKVLKAVAERKRKAEIVAVINNTQSNKPEELIFPIPHPENPNKVKGYIVRGLFDNEGNPIPEKRFDDVTNRWNLHRANKYIDQVKSLLKNKAPVTDWTKVDTVYKCDKKGIDQENLPKYINVCNYKGKKSGYVVNGYPLPGGKKSCKKFTNTTYNSIEELYEQALEYLDSLKRNHPIK